MIDTIAFAILPYVVVAVELVGSLWRFYANRFKFSSLSSEFLESRQLFWGSVPWHYGILTVLAGHVIGFMFPREVLVWNRVPVRLLILEVTALVFGIQALIGLCMLIYRRATHARIRAVTTTMDIVVLVLLLNQVATGVGIALTYRWGSSWYAAALVPYLRSVFLFKPNLEFIAPMPWMVKLHVINAFVIVGVLPFTRLVHFLLLPISYLWRPYQLVIWNRDWRKWRTVSKKGV